VSILKSALYSASDISDMDGYKAYTIGLLKSTMLIDTNIYLFNRRTALLHALSDDVISLTFGSCVGSFNYILQIRLFCYHFVIVRIRLRLDCGEIQAVWQQ